MKSSTIFILLALTWALLSSCSLGDDAREQVAEHSKAASASTLAYVNGCTACHEIRSSIQGPSWFHVAERYRGRSDAKEYLKNRIRNGGEPNWTKITGGAEMHAYGNRVSEDHLNRILDYILSVK